MVRTSTNLPNTSISEMGQYYALEVADQILHDRQLCNFIARTVMEIGCWERRIERSDWSSRAADRLTGQSRGCCRACRSPRSLHVIRGIGLVVCSSVEVEDFRQICLFFGTASMSTAWTIPGRWFADSPLEQSGFEPSVPRDMTKVLTVFFPFGRP